MPVSFTANKTGTISPILLFVTWGGTVQHGILPLLREYE
jgi:hypothetical protein